jgi:hypothetical protein
LFAVGFGGAMIWFGSSAGVTLPTMYPHVTSAAPWLLDDWFVLVADVAGAFVMLAVLGWHPDPPRRMGAELPTRAPWCPASGHRPRQNTPSRCKLAGKGVATSAKARFACSTC